jgi:hypothetical protein
MWEGEYRRRMGIYFEGVSRYFNAVTQNFRREVVKGYESTQASYAVPGRESKRLPPEYNAETLDLHQL